MRNSIDTLQAGRAFAALSVLLFHTNVTLGLKKYLGTDVFPIFNAGNSGVQFFFVLSGFVIFYAHRSDLGRSQQLGRYMFRRFSRLVPPLWVVLSLVTIIHAFMPGGHPARLTSHLSRQISCFSRRRRKGVWLLSGHSGTRSFFIWSLLSLL